MHGKSKDNLKNIDIFCSFTENWNEWESDQRENGQQGNETFGKILYTVKPCYIGWSRKPKIV